MTRRNTRVLFCPLNWGLGHASRCIPLIRDQINKGNKVHIASDGDALLFLQREFPKLTFHRLPSYNIRYSEKGLGVKFIFRLPGIRKAIQAEKQIISVLQAKHNFGLIISDNRYGCFSSDCKSVLISHQLNIQTPNKLISSTINNVQFKYFANFDEIWVPDFDGTNSLAGDLSKNVKNLNVRYLGPLSRMVKTDSETERDILIVLSGPEPQRTLLEDILFAQLRLLPYSALVIRGKPGENDSGNLDGVDYISFATSNELEKYMNTSRLVVCRSGYSSLMDLYELNKKAILIPTPGQSEQEYLADYHHDNPMWTSSTQENLDLRSAIELLFSKKRQSDEGGQAHRLFVVGSHRMRHTDGAKT